MPPTEPAPLISASQLAVEALGLTPLGTPWRGREGNVLCALEARPLRMGELVMPWKPGPNFMDDRDTADSPLMNGYAAALCAKSVMLKTQRMLFTRDGAYSLATDAARAWFYLTPPEPPFVAVLADSMLQHLIWRTPVTHSRNWLIVRLGQRILHIRRPRLIAARDALLAYGQPAFVRLDREGKDGLHGRLRNDVPSELARELADLTPGELVALATLAKRNPPTPEQPEPIRLGDAA